MNFLSLYKRNLIYKFKKKIQIDRDDFESNSLDTLFNYYGSDKANIFKISNKIGHGYSKFYENESLGVYKSVTPKKGRVVIFNGLRYHCSTRPSKGYRTVINYNVI